MERENLTSGRFYLVSLSFFANLGSLVGLAATLWTAWSAYRSKRYYLLVGRVPDQIEDLQNSTSEPVDVNNDPEAERRDRLRALKEVRIALESIARNIGWRHKSEFLNLKARITKIEEEEPLDPDTLDDFWAEAEALAGKAEEIVRDSKFARGS
jgi:hypothetical protein